METLDRITPAWAKALIVITALAGFAWLASYSMGHGYTPDEVAAFNALHARLMSEMEAKDYLTQLEEAL